MFNLEFCVHFKKVVCILITGTKNSTVPALIYFIELASFSASSCNPFLKKTLNVVLVLQLFLIPQVPHSLFIDGERFRFIAYDLNQCV